ncbi:MAG: 50S ribosomal protein L11 methyltransferase [Rhodothalassiaceae bacterium]
MTTWRLDLTVPQAAVPAIETGVSAVFDDGRGAVPAVAAFEVDEAAQIWRVEVYFAGEPSEDQLTRAQHVAQDALGHDMPNFRAEPLPETDWVGLSQSMLDPVAAGRFFVHGSHDRAMRRPGRINLEIEAGQAFGTGRHETTKTCLTALDELAKHFRPRRALDVGTGSGILAFAIARVWRIPVWAGDIDPVSIGVLQTNAAVNAIPVARPGWGVRAFTAAGVGHAEVRAARPFDLVCANILAEPLIDLAPEIPPLVARGGRLILSGLLTRQAPAVLAAYRARGLVLARRYRLGDWTTLLLKRR